MRALIIDPGKAPEVTTQLPNDEQGIACWLGGPVHMRPFGQYPAALLYNVRPGVDLPNRHYIDRWYHGRLIIVGYKSYRLMPLPKDLAAQMARQWADVEVVAK